MRAKSRISTILNALLQVWKKLPGMEFGLFLSNVAADPALYYMEDGAILAATIEYYENLIDYYSAKVDYDALNEENKQVFIEKLEAIWSTLPDLRLGQLLCNVLRGATLSYISNDDLLAVLKQYYSEVK